MMENMEDFEGFTLNYEEIVKSKSCLAITRLLAADLMRNPYLNVGDYIKNISDADLYSLVQQIEREDEKQYEDFILISEMLATGEGCPPAESSEVFAERMNYLVTTLICESLARKGLVRLFYENVSFHEDMKDKMMVEKI